jgi:hypothetical protein
MNLRLHSAGVYAERSRRAGMTQGEVDFGSTFVLFAFCLGVFGLKES